MLVVVALVGLGYFYYSGSSTPASTTLIAESDEGAAAAAQVLSLLNQIQVLKIDTAIFSDPGYKTLRDYSVAIPPVNVGRPNPFAPISR